MASPIVSQALDRFASTARVFESSSREVISRNASAVSAAIADFCLKSRISPPTGSRTLTDVGNDVGQKIGEYCALQSESGYRAALSLLKLCGQLHYKLLLNLVAKPIGPGNANGWSSPITVGGGIFETFHFDGGQALYDLVRNIEVGPARSLNPKLLCEPVEFHGSIYGVFQVYSQGLDSLQFVNLTANRDCFRVDNWAEATNLAVGIDGIYLGVVHSETSTYTLYNLTKQTVVFSKSFEHEGETITAGSLEVFSGQVYLTILSKSGWTAYNQSTGVALEVPDVVNHMRDAIECNGSVFKSFGDGKGWTTYNLTTGKKVGRVNGRFGGELTACSGAIYQEVGDALDEDGSTAEVYNVTSGSRLTLRDGTNVSRIQRVGNSVFVCASFSTIDGVAWRSYDLVSGEQVGLESHGLPSDLVGCNGEVYQLASVGGLLVTYNLSTKSECAVPSELVDHCLPIGSNGRVFQSAELGDETVHYDLKRGAQIMHGAAEICVAGNWMVFRDAELRKQYLIALDQV